jgi:hypothetical protein
LLYVAVRNFGAAGAAAAWSARSLCDPALFFMSGNIRRVWRFILPPLAMILMAIATALLTQWRDPLYWTCLGALLFVATAHSIRISPVAPGKLLGQMRIWLVPGTQESK